MRRGSVVIKDLILDRAAQSFRIIPSFFALSFAAGITFYYLYSVVRVPVSINTSVSLEFENPPCNCTLKVPLNTSEQGIDSRRLFYNRVSKCGSTTLYNLLEKLSYKHNYTHLHSLEYNRRYADILEQQEIVQLLKTAPPPCSYDRHLFFINFTMFGERPPVYINMIREPVERMISFFYYQRALSLQTRRLSDDRMNQTFEECFLAQDPECRFWNGRYRNNMQLTYFCGQEYRCQSLNDPWAINRAKQNIEMYYAVVGILEEMNVTLQVLEAELPQFFGGVYEMYHSSGVRENQNPQKKQVKEKIKTLLKAKLTGEYELYHFVKQRLHGQYQSLVQARRKTEQNEEEIPA